MVEYWKVGFQPDGIHIIVSCGNFIDNALDHFSFTQYSSIPVFQHSNCKESQIGFSLVIYSIFGNTLRGQE
jgi:hypothetical protein